jgi:hypothetical protein
VPGLQICGEFTVFAGWVAATFLVFKRSECVRGWTADGQLHAHSDQETDLLGDRRTRYFELCRLSTPLASVTRSRHWWYCDDCRALMRRLTPERDADRINPALVSWRWWAAEIGSR